MHRVRLSASLWQVRQGVLRTSVTVSRSLCRSRRTLTGCLHCQRPNETYQKNISRPEFNRNHVYSLSCGDSNMFHTSVLGGISASKHRPTGVPIHALSESANDKFNKAEQSDYEEPMSVMAEMILQQESPANENEDDLFEDTTLQKFSQRIEEMESFLDTNTRVTDFSPNEPHSLEASNTALDDEDSDCDDSDSDYDDIGSEDYFTRGPKSLEYLADPSVPTSSVPCAGCGALLHCNDHQKPGFMSSHKYKATSSKKLREHTCLRCNQLATHRTALNITVNPEEYVKVIKKMKKLTALCVLVVDVTDFPNSLIHNLPELIGKNRPLYIVGNKVDLLPRDSKGYLHRTKVMIKNYLRKTGMADSLNIKNVSLISAKTGYGIEDLVTRLMEEWEKRGDVYLLGTTNSGKSTLFNALLSSDYCKDTARDFIHRATTSTWPGTTLNLLKFPIINPAPWRLEQRTKRLKKERPIEVEESILRRKKFESTKDVKFATLTGNVGQTFIGVKTKAIEEAASQYAGFISATYSYKPGAVTEVSGGRRAAYDQLAKLANVADYSEELFRDANWCYDTPGVINSNQVTNLLNQDELSVVFGQDQVNAPRSYVIKPGQVLFLSGLGRLDYTRGNTSVYLTVISSKKLPVHVVDYSVADTFYRENICTKILKVPMRGPDELNRLPSLIGREVHVQGIGWEESAMDIQLSSLGWVSVTAGTGMEVSMRAYTPGGRGCVVRTPSLLPHAVNLRGRRMGKSAAYKIKVKTKAF